MAASKESQPEVVRRPARDGAKPSLPRERRWAFGFEINVNSRRPVMRGVTYQIN
jgi:hypothetical protein